MREGRSHLGNVLWVVKGQVDAGMRMLLNWCANDHKVVAAPDVF